MSDTYYCNGPGPQKYTCNMKAVWPQSPRYSLKSRSTILECRRGFPSPDCYKVSQSQTWKKSPQYSFGQRTSRCQPVNNPSPNAYRPKEQKTQETITLSSRYPQPNSMQWETEHEKHVSPAEYSVQRPSSAPSFSMKSRHPETFYRSSTPGRGPQSYDSMSPYKKTVKSAPRYSLKSRHTLESKSITPSPISYSSANPFKRKASYSLKSRHSYEGINIGSAEFRYKFFLM